jgi:CRP/FNR family transcriptional regulator
MSTVCPVNVSRPTRSTDGCPNCGFIAWCLPANLTAHESKQVHERIRHRHLIKRNERLYYAGAALTSLFVINSGFVRTSITNSDGREQITGFSMAGELVGMEGFGMGKHLCDRVALEDSSLCGIAYTDFEQLTRDIPALRHHVYREMGAEIARSHRIMLLLGSMHAEERVAMFLLNVSGQASALGYSKTHFRVSMTRKDIGNYLGLKLETVSRAFSHFNNTQLIAINGKDVEIENLVQLRQIAGDYGTCGPCL